MRVLNNIQNYKRDESGVAATEFALVAPFLIFIAVGIFDYGMYLNTTMKLENTARSIAQYILVGGDPANIEDEVILPGSLGLSEETRDDITVTTSYEYQCSDGLIVGEGSNCGEDDYLRQYVRVLITQDYDTIIPFPGIPDVVTLRSEVRMQNS